MTSGHTSRNPATVPPPFAAYSQAVETAPALRWLHISGQVGVTPDGRLMDGAEEQMRQTWCNILAVLTDAGMGPRDLVKVTNLIVRHEHLAILRRVRAEMLGPVEPASTLIIVAGLADPDWLVEIEAIAAAP